jgi:multiple sugar transport system substrate-binding protein
MTIAKQHRILPILTCLWAWFTIAFCFGIPVVSGSTGAGSVDKMDQVDRMNRVDKPATATISALPITSTTSTLSTPSIPPPSSRLRVEFWHAMSGPEAGEIITSFVREFEQLHPDIHVVPVYQGNYNQLSQKLIASVIARSNPVIAQMYEGWTSRFLTRNLLDPVQNYLHGEDGLTTAELEDIWEPFRRNNSWNGQLVTLPFNKSAFVLCANMDMLRAKGYDHPPETWDELRRMSKDLTVRESGRSSANVYGFLMRARIEALTIFLFRAGGAYLSEDWKSPISPNREALESLRFLRAMSVEDGSAYVDSGYPSTPFGAGQVAMFVHSSASFAFNDQAVRGKFQWVAAPIPHPEGRKGGVLFQGTNIGIFERPHSPEVRLAAWKFLKFVTNTRNAARWSIATGYVPVRRSCLDLPEMKDFLEKNPNYRVPIDLIPEATFDPRPDYWDQMRPQIETNALDTINGRLTPEEAMARIAQKLREIIAYESR